jgi:large subunit ribosomal protein L9
MKVLLQKPVDKLGQPGDIVEVADGYARNYLVPQGMAIKAAKGTVRQAESMKRAHDVRQSKEKTEHEAVASTLIAAGGLTIRARAGEEGKLFGSVTSADIAQQLAEQGFHVEKRQIDLKEPLKALGVYRVPVRLHADVHPEIKVWVIKQ